MLNTKELQERRKVRARYQIKQKAKGRIRLSVARSGRHMYAQVIDDAKGITVAAASTLEMRDSLKSGADKEASAAVGKLVAERALKAGIKQVVFDRGSYVYHGRVAALADAAREAGLDF